MPRRLRVWLFILWPSCFPLDRTANAQNATSPGGAMPALGAGSMEGEPRFDFHGYFRAPLRVGEGSRPGPAGAHQSATVLHEPLLLDDQVLNWNYTRAQEKSLAELYFSYGNSLVAGTIAVTANNFDEWERLSNAQFGTAQGWLTLRPDLGRREIRLVARVGAFQSRYGMAGGDDAGPYDTYLMGRTHQMGEVLAAELDLPGGDVTLKAEHGLGAHGEEQLFMFDNGTIATAFTLLHHAHLGVTFRGRRELSLHYMNAFTVDSRGTDPEGSLRVLGVDGRVDAGVFGDLYLGFASLRLTHALGVGPAIETIHSFGANPFGLDFVANLLGPGSQGDGTVNTFEFNYAFRFGSLWRTVRDSGTMEDEAPDVRLAFFGMFSRVARSDVPAWDGLRKFKYGADLAAQLWPWLEVGARYDRVQPNLDDGSIAFSAVSPRVVVHPSIVGNENVALVYSHYAYGSALRAGPIANDTNHPGLGLPRSYGSSVQGTGAFPLTGGDGPVDRAPDGDVISVKATMTW